jgi:hypothetical protein
MPMLKSDRAANHAADLGKLGGNATLEKYGKEHFKKLSKKGVKARKK